MVIGKIIFRLITFLVLNAFIFTNKRSTVDQNEQQLTDTISVIMSRIEAKKQPIRNVLNDQLALKKCLNELAKELFESIETG